MNKFKNSPTLTFSDGFQWKEVTDSAMELYNSVALFELFDDESESQIESKEYLQYVLDSGGQVFVEWGFVDSEQDKK